MTISDVITLFEFDRWAVEQTLGFVSSVSDAKYLENLRSSHGGIHTTLLHVCSADWLWLERWKGRSPTAHLSPQEVPDLPSLKARWSSHWDELNGFLKTLTEERLAAPLGYNDLRGNAHAEPLYQQIQHAVNHSSYHRGQVVTMLRQQGGKPVSTDLIAFYRESGPART
jgi:uncharacterized damage-inducible protein DinB